MTPDEPPVILATIDQLKIGGRLAGARSRLESRRVLPGPWFDSAALRSQVYSPVVAFSTRAISASAIHERASDGGREAQ